MNKRILLFILYLCQFLELSHLVIPNRSFQFSDLFGNILGVLISILIIKIYNKVRKMSSFDERQKGFEKKAQMKNFNLKLMQEEINI